MDVSQDSWERLLAALFRLLLNPFYYIGILFVVLHYRRQIIMERKLFSHKLHSFAAEVVRTILFGIGAGLAASLLLSITGIKLEPGTVVVLWMFTLVLLFLRVRFLCLAYAAGLLGLIQLTLSYVPGWNDSSWPGALGWLQNSIQGADLPSLFMLVAVLHIIEGILILLQGKRLASPLFLGSKRGKIVGGYHLQGFWPVPLFLLAPVAGGTLAPFWDPLFSGSWTVSGWDFLIFPAVIGFSQMTASFLPHVKLRQTAAMTIIFGLFMLTGAFAAFLWTPIGWVVSLGSILLHEGIIWYGNRMERKHSPAFVNSEKGLMILAILPGSAAETVGLVPGEIIHKINGELVKTKEELHVALRLNPAFCKLEVINLEGQIKFASRALYEDEHHQMGIVLAPDDRAAHYVKAEPFSFASYLRRKWIMLIRNERPTDFPL